MRLFQLSGLNRSYRPRLARLTRDCSTFDAAMRVFAADRYIAVHFLKPVIEKSSDAFFANGDDDFSQRLWAKEHGMSDDATREDILLAQIEEHRTEIFYNLDPVAFGDALVQRLPGTVRRTVAWRAAPSGGAAFLKHDIIVNNFPSLLEGYRAQGARTEYFFPAHDPEMDFYAAAVDRPIDVVFVGTFSRHHRNRVAMLESVARLRDRMSVALHLDVSRFTRLAETPLGWAGPLRKYRRSPDIRATVRGPVHGRDLLAVLGNAKIVVNGAIDMSSIDRGNMRVWEALGCGALLLSDSGNYPPGLADGAQYVGYGDPREVPDLIAALIADDERRKAVATEGHRTISTRYSKDIQWRRFQEIVS
jgi:glycosyltransferase involved in cell wall biosynthesis